MKKKFYLVTHDELCHTDDIAVIALLLLYFENFTEYEVVIVRTRDEKILSYYQQNSDAIVFDVGGGKFDHHKDEMVDGRYYSSIGKVWAEFKEKFIEVFQLDEESWENIDNNLVRHIDKTDNTGEMNPLNYTFNAVRSSIAENEMSEQTVNECISFMKTVWKSILISEKKRTDVRKEYYKLPIIKLCNLRWRYNDSGEHFIVGSNDPSVDGYIWKTNKGTFKVKAPGKIKSGLDRNESLGIIFTHKGGWLGEITDLKYLQNILI